jgi:hypothetical protein
MEGIRMPTSQELFENAVVRLRDIYKDNPACLEAVELTAKIALEAENTGAAGATYNAPGLGGAQGTATVAGPQMMSGKYKNATNMTKLTSPHPNRGLLTGSKNMLLRWASVEPVECKKWVDGPLAKRIEAAAVQKFGQSVDGDWKSNFERALNTTKEGLEAESDKIAAETKAKQAAEQNKAAGGQDKAGFFSKVKKGISNLFNKNKKEAEEAIKSGDKEKMEAVRLNMLKLKAFCESYGFTIEEALMD